MVTAGGFRLTRDGRGLVITPLPHATGPTIPLRLRPAALPWEMPEPTHVETLDAEGHVVARRSVTRRDGTIVVESEPGVFAYRLVGEETKPSSSSRLSGSGKIR